MKSATTGTVSGCVVWMIVFCVLSIMCLPGALVGAPVGMMTIDFSPGFVEDILGPYVCPQESTAEIVTHATTVVDSSGVGRPGTAFRLQCVDSIGNVVREPSPDSLFIWVGIWVGIFAVIGLILSALIAFLLATPAGVVIGNLSNRLRKANTSDNRRAEDIKQRTATGIPATAIVVMDPASITARKKGLLNIHLILDVQPPAGDVYRAITDWTVDLIAASQLKRGQPVAVRIDANDPNIIYPDVPGATFSHLPKNYWSGTTHHHH